MVSIGPHQLRNGILLAPMAGVTDAPFRDLAWRFGAGYLVSEMLSAKADLWNTEKSRLRRQRVAGAHPFVVQIAGGDPETVAEGAFRHWRAGAEIIDINFGCPAKKVCRKAAGSQLLKDEKLVAGIVRAAVKSVPVPVTVKMRTGWSLELKNGVRIARILEGEGIAAVVVHGRTRACKFHGAVEYDTVAEIKSRLSIPVFANGDIDSMERAQTVLSYTGADGVMIGRGALGAPWLLGQIAAGTTTEPTMEEKLGVMLEHVASLHHFYGDPGVRIARKHVRWYLTRMKQDPFDENLRNNLREFNKLEDATAQLAYLVDLSGKIAA
ncbi:MAG: tRNA dihydrouridine synthase DusB [Gammaproteobacteria bacterium]|nr:tRNA dihydrouridine synthase DusB [Gammaproteobacteria bacterium]